MVDVDGRPVARADVRIADEVPDADRPPLVDEHVVMSSGPLRSGVPSRRTVTDAAGRFRLDAFDAPLQRLVVQAADLWTDVRVILRDPQRPLRIALGPEQPLAGIVIDPQGRPIAGARVAARREDSDWPARAAVLAETDERGRFRVRGLPKGGDFWVAAWREGGPARVLRFEAGVDERRDPSNVEIVLPATRLLRVRATDLDAGGPVWGATLVVRSGDGQLIGIAHSSDDGRADVLVAETGPWEVTGRHPSYRGGFSRVEPDAPTAETGVAMHPACRIVGRVVSPAGSPLEGVKCQWANDPREEGRSGADGRFAVEHAGCLVPALLFLSKPGFPFAQVVGRGTMREGVLDVGDVVFARGVDLTVRVLDPDGTLLEDAWLEVKEEGREPALHRDVERGSVHVGPVLPGRLRLSAGHQRLRQVVTETVVQGEGEARTIDLTLGRGASIEGVVLDVAGDPVDGAIVSTDEKTVDADRLGRFVLEGLAPGTHRLKVNGGRQWWDATDVLAGGPPVTLRAVRER